jgi:hypothetical protein
MYNICLNIVFLQYCELAWQNLNKIVLPMFWNY